MKIMAARRCYENIIRRKSGIFLPSTFLLLLAYSCLSLFTLNSTRTVLKSHSALTLALSMSLP